MFGRLLSRHDGSMLSSLRCNKQQFGLPGYI
jgi:hypothetical protein